MRIADVVKEVVEPVWGMLMMLPKGEEWLSKLRVGWAIQAGTPTHAWLDPTRTVQIVGNLLKNGALSPRARPRRTVRGGRFMLGRADVRWSVPATRSSEGRGWCRFLFGRAVSAGCKFTKEGGSVQLDVYVVEPEAPSGAVAGAGSGVSSSGSDRPFPAAAAAAAGVRWLCFSVKDTGIGIDPGQIAQIFEPFTQLDSASDRKFEGAGLGLAICSKLAAALSGRLECHSAGLGRGATFRLLLPLAAAAGGAAGGGGAATADSAHDDGLSRQASAGVDVGSISTGMLSARPGFQSPAAPGRVGGPARAPPVEFIPTTVFERSLRSVEPSPGKARGPWWRAQWSTGGARQVWPVTGQEEADAPSAPQGGGHSDRGATEGSLGHAGSASMLSLESRRAGGSCGTDEAGGRSAPRLTSPRSAAGSGESPALSRAHVVVSLGAGGATPASPSEAALPEDGGAHEQGVWLPPSPRAKDGGHRSTASASGDRASSTGNWQWPDPEQPDPPPPGSLPPAHSLPAPAFAAQPAPPAALAPASSGPVAGRRRYSSLTGAAMPTVAEPEVGEEGEHQPPAPEHARAPRVLIAEDDRMSRTLIIKMLQRFGYEVRAHGWLRSRAPPPLLAAVKKEEPSFFPSSNVWPRP